MTKRTRMPLPARREPAAVCVSAPKLACQRVLINAAREFRWNLVDLEITQGALPDLPPPVGAIITGMPAASLRRRLRDAGAALVVMGAGTAKTRCKTPAVLADLAAQGRLAVDHFAERGFRQLGYVGHAPWAGAKPLYDAFCQQAAKRKIACAVCQFETPSKPDSLSPAARFKRRSGQLAAWIDRLPRPLGLFTYNDFIAGRLCAMVQAAGWMVPEEVALLGRGNQEYACEVSPVGLSSIDEDYEAMTWEAVRLLQRLMSGESAPPAPILIPPKGVVERRSTNVLAIGDPLVARALRYLWDHLDLDLSVDAVAEELGVHRMKLERAFRAHLARGVNAELRRKRLETLCWLLRSTDLPIAQLAPLTGFQTLANLHKTFRQAHGISPRQYRVRAARSG